MTATEKYVNVLACLKAGQLGLLRKRAGRNVDEAVNAFDLFTGLWWPLRQESPRAPRREVAWLIAKLYAFRPMPQSAKDTVARRLGHHLPARDPAKARFIRSFDQMVALPLGSIEPGIQWALGVIASGDGKLDWVRLTDDLSVWERETTRIVWAEEFLVGNEGRQSC